MEKSNKTPKLRFPGFTDDWEQRKFSELVTIERGGSPRPIDKYITKDENGLNWVKIGDAPNQGNYITQTAEKIRPEGLSKTREVHPGDLILSNSMSFGKPYIMAIDGCIHDGWLTIRDNQKIFDLKFLCILLGTDNMLSQYKAMAAGSTVNNLNKELVGGTTVLYPSMDEQIKLGELFEDIDNLITLHQREYDKMVEYKKGMLQKMFPKDGETVPEIRFPGFTDDWEQRKLGELAEIKDSARIPNAEWSASGVPYIRASDITNEDASGVLFISHERYEFYKNKTGAPAKGDVLFNGGGEIGKTMLKSSDSPIYVQGGAVLYARTSVSDSLDEQYLKSYFETPNAQHYFETASAGGTMKHFTLKPSQEMPIKLPQMEEQKRIGECFSELDNLITLHQRECEALKKYKKGLLQQMFV